MNEGSSRRRPTIRELATLAGVSRATVSRVLNGGQLVSPKSLAAVERAIAQTGYRVNPHARSLVTGRSNSIAFLLTEPQQLLFEDPTFGVLLRGAGEALARHDQTLSLIIAATEAERSRVLEYVASKHVDGVLLISSHEADPLLPALVDSGVPLVTCGLPLGDGDRVASVSVDEAGATRAMMRHLRERGCRRIAHIAGPQDTPGGRFRCAAYVEESKVAGQEPLVAVGDYSRDSGSRAMQELLSLGDPPDGVFVASDLMASGALTALRNAGIRVPDEIAVGGFDDTGLAAAVEPALTTMAQPFARISEEMVTILLDLIDGGVTRSVTFPAHIVIRDST